MLLAKIGYFVSEATGLLEHIVMARFQMFIFIEILAH